MKQILRNILILTSIFIFLVIYTMTNNSLNFVFTGRKENRIMLTPDEENDIFSTADSKFYSQCVGECTDINFVEKSPSIYFIIVVKEQNTSVTLRTSCAIESASKYNPSSIIKVLLVPWNNDDVDLTQLDNWKNNVKKSMISARKILENTPLEKWYQEGSFRGGRFAITHLSDALRLAILWKFGGIYLDTDVWCVKPMSQLRNTIGAESASFINGAVLIFDKFHQFLYEAMTEFVKRYTERIFGIVGPRLLTNLVKIKCNIKGDLDSIAWESYKRCLNVSVLPPSCFYPVHHTQIRKFFRNDWVTNVDSYSFHLWNHFTSYMIVNINPESKVLLEEIAEKSCPKTFAVMQRRGLF